MNGVEESIEIMLDRLKTTAISYRDQVQDKTQVEAFIKELTLRQRQLKRTGTKNLYEIGHIWSLYTIMPDPRFWSMHISMNLREITPYIDHNYAQGVKSGEKLGIAKGMKTMSKKITALACIQDVQYHRTRELPPRSKFVDFGEEINAFTPSTKLEQNPLFVMPVLHHVATHLPHQRRTACVPFISTAQPDHLLYVFISKSKEWIEKYMGEFTSKRRSKIFSTETYDISNIPIYIVIVVNNVLITSMKTTCKTKSLILANVFLSSDTSDETHENGLLIDTVNKHVERIEPNGSIADLVDEDHTLTQATDFALSYFSTKIIPDIDKFYQGYSYSPPEYTCPMIGPQIKQLDPDQSAGFCVSWITLILHLRLLNPDYKTFEINALILEKSPADLFTLVQKYTSYMDGIIEHEYPHLVD
jgi:hypothetical protein